jgi:hypothetical protein
LLGSSGFSFSAFWLLFALVAGFGCLFFFFKLGGLLPPAHPRRPASGTGAHPHPVRAVAVGVGAVARDLRRPQCGPPRGRQPHLSLSTYKRGAREGERGSWQVVEKQRGKDLGKVVTGGGEGTEAEGTEKANHRGHGEHGEKQTTEDTEKTKPQRAQRTRR